MTEYVLVSSEEIRYSSTAAEQKHICPFEEYVCCYMSDYSGILTGINTTDGHYDVI